MAGARTLDAICRSLAAVTAADVTRVARRIGPVPDRLASKAPGMEPAAHHGEGADA